MNAQAASLWSYIGTLIVGFFIGFLTGAFSEAGRDFWRWFKLKYILHQIPEIEVTAEYKQNGYPPGRLEWIPSLECEGREKAGWMYYLDKERDVRVFRTVGTKYSRPQKTYLMVKPSNS